MNVLIWFKRDLRVHDHPALSLAAGLGPVLPVYVVEPELWAQPDASARQWEVVAEGLADLREALAGIGAPLVVRVGGAVQVLEALCRRHGIARIVSHEETGTLWTYARDRRVAAWARSAGVEWTEVPQSGVVRRLPTRDIWAASRDGFMAQPALSLAAGLGPVLPV
ncbi:MAG: deoxyribodipyrimidine photo-lyase, partial [Tabrizicola sp.]|nr:deoxyribodipyrimidine photo-lyase [Tabrizicola sp.]